MSQENQDIRRIRSSIDDLILNDLLNLSCKCAVERDDVASIRVYSCNMALAVKVACADQSFADICFPASESHSIPTFSPHKPPWSRMSSPVPPFCQWKYQNRCTRVVRPSQPTSESRCCDLPGVSNDAKSRELARTGCGCSTATAWFPCRTTEPTNNFLVRIWIIPLVLIFFASFLAILAIAFPFHAFLAVFAKAVHNHWI